MRFLQFAILMPFIFTSSCSHPGGNILIVLPSGYSGKFYIVKDDKAGINLAESGGQWVFVIPASGTLKIKNDSMFYKYHSIIIQDAKGNRLSWEFISTVAGQSDTDPTEFATKFNGTTHTWFIK